MDWLKVLKEHRQSRALLGKEDPNDNRASWDSLWENAKPQFDAIQEQLEQYYLECFSSSQQQSTAKSNKVQLIKDTRNALRLGLSCLSIPDDQVRVEAQRYALDFVWRRRRRKIDPQAPSKEKITKDTTSVLLLAGILCAPKGDGTCRLLCARLLSNLVTGHAANAKIVATQLPLAPSAESVSKQFCKMESWSRNSKAH